MVWNTTVMKSDGIPFDLEMRVGEDWIGGSKRNRTPVIYPATGEIIAEGPVATDDDARASLEAAARAQPEWARHSPAERAAFLLRIAELVRKNRPHPAPAQRRRQALWLGCGGGVFVRASHLEQIGRRIRK
jgi:Aldehyde dehydrogenase family